MFSILFFTIMEGKEKSEQPFIIIEANENVRTLPIALQLLRLHHWACDGGCLSCPSCGRDGAALKVLLPEETANDGAALRQMRRPFNEHMNTKMLATWMLAVLGVPSKPSPVPVPPVFCFRCFSSGRAGRYHLTLSIFSSKKDIKRKVTCSPPASTLRITKCTMETTERRAASY